MRIHSLKGNTMSTRVSNGQAQERKGRDEFRMLYNDGNSHFPCLLKSEKLDWATHISFHTTVRWPVEQEMDRSVRSKLF